MPASRRRSLAYDAAMRHDLNDPIIQDLLREPAPATLTTYRKDGEAVTSPVWFQVVDGVAEVVIALGDPKIGQLERDARCQLVIFDAVPPFRAVRARGRATLEPDDDAVVRRAVASRYLGPDRGRAYAEGARRAPGFVMRLPLDDVQAWDLAAKLP